MSGPALRPRVSVLPVASGSDYIEDNGDVKDKPGTVRRGRKRKTPGQSVNQRRLTLSSNRLMHMENGRQSEETSFDGIVKQSTRSSGASKEKKKKESVHDDLDRHKHNRKRRSTGSPDELSSTNIPYEGTLEKQFHGAPTDSGISSSPTFGQRSGISEVSMLHVEANQGGVLNAVPPRNSHTELSEETEKLPQDQTSAWNGTPKRKMLKLRTDGKLVSPKAHTTAGISKTRTMKKGDKRKTSLLHKIVIIKYGSDQERRSLFGQKIQDILAGPVQRVETLLATVPVTQKVALSTDPPKPTHPFFTGNSTLPGNGRSTEVRKAAGCGGDLDKNTAVTTSTATPRRNPRVILQKDADAWSKIAAGFSKPPRIPGAFEPLWPPNGMVHCRGLLNNDTAQSVSLHNIQTRLTHKKLKEAETPILEHEEILYKYGQLSQQERKRLEESRSFSAEVTVLRKPRRKLMTGSKLQDILRQRIVSNLPAAEKSLNKEQEVFITGNMSSQVATHNALLRIFHGIKLSLAPFDRFECEMQDWVHKYAPKCAADVLQPGQEVLMLRDWLKGLIVTSIVTGTADAKTRELPVVPKMSIVRVRKKRRRAEELDGFIISTDDEADELDELTEPEDLADSNLFSTKRSMLRAGDRPGVSLANGEIRRATNAVVISGPHGCGKTAAVYAVAQELDFEVFEINSGSRRSGKDLVDKVGDMARNHLVHQTATTDNLEESDEHMVTIQQELDSGRQSTMQSFLKPNAKSKAHSKSRPTSKQRVKDPPPKSPKKQKQQKQSLILLEEVDVLFEEDKQFWATTLSLILQSKRPIIMTCTDESLLPLDDMVLYAIFRFAPPTEQLAVDYLLLLAGNEGHLLQRDAVISLYTSKHRDLRATISELNFWCQMAIGDSKGGLDWMLIRSNAEEYLNDEGLPLRVVSDSTYLEGMGLFGRDGQSKSVFDDITKSTTLLSQAVQWWKVGLDDWPELYQTKRSSFAKAPETSRESLQLLETSDLVADALSVADLLPNLGLRLNETAILDNGQPELTDKLRSNYTEGTILLQAEPLQDFTDLSVSIPLTIMASSGKAIQCVQRDSHACNVGPGTVVRTIIDKARQEQDYQPSLTEIMASAFEPLYEAPRTSLNSRGPQITSFQCPTSTIAQDIAPYIRSIVSYDIRLEQQRLQLSNLMSEGGRKGKRPRTTRASRAALEGGSKANTRRERWFSKGTNFAMVLRTGGEGWQDTALQRLQGEWSGGGSGYDGSRRSSLATTGSDVQDTSAKY